MNITKESTGELTAEIKIQINEDDYNEPVSKTLKDYQRKANIPGFRPGKVPFSLIKKMYGKAVQAEEINKVLSDSLTKYITDNKLDIFGNPLPDKEKQKAIDFDTQKDFDFYFDIGIIPDFELILSDKIKVVYNKIIADDKTIDLQLKQICQQFGELTNPETSSEEDSVYGKIEELDQDGKIKEGGINNNSSILINKINPKKAREIFIGIKKNDFVDFNPFKAIGNFHDIAGLLNIDVKIAESLESDFRFTINEINHVKPASVDEKLFSKVYIEDNLKNEKELKNSIKADIEKSYTQESDFKFFLDTKNKLIEITNIPLPDDFLKKQMLEMNEKEIPDNELIDQYDKYAESMKWQLIENKLVKENKIEITEEEIKEHFKKLILSQMNIPQVDEKNTKFIDEIAGNMMKKEDEVRNVVNMLVVLKLVELFKSLLKLNNKNISMEDFIKLANK